MTHLVGAVYQRNYKNMLLECKEADPMGYEWVSNIQGELGIRPRMDGGGNCHESLLDNGYTVIKYPKEDLFDSLYKRMI